MSKDKVLELAFNCQCDLLLARSRLELDAASLPSGVRHRDEGEQRLYVLGCNPFLHLERHVGPDAVGRFTSWYERYLPYAHRKARRWADRHDVDFALLARDAAAGLMQGLARYDRGYGVKVEQYARFWIEAALHKRMKQINDPYPEDDTAWVPLDTLLSAEDLAKRLGLTPFRAEAGETDDDQRAVLQFARPTVFESDESRDAFATPGCTNDDPVLLQEVLPDATEGVTARQAAFDLKVLLQAIRNLLPNLNDVSFILIEQRYFADKPLSLRELKNCFNQPGVKEWASSQTGAARITMHLLTMLEYHAILKLRDWLKKSDQ